MRPKLKLYLDTSVISALFDERNPERKSLTESFFSGIDKYEIYISPFTLAEIEKTPDKVIKQKMIGKVSKFQVLNITRDIEEFTDEIVLSGAINQSYSEDAFHIATAIMSEMDFLLSWNFRHIVRKKTKDIIRMITTINNLRQIEIVTPAELL
jgi:predicted nucleic acid-binding protein